MTLHALVAGDSHTLCMGPGNEAIGPLHDIIFEDAHLCITRMRPSTRRSKFDGSYWDSVSSEVSGKIAVISWKGNQHIVGALFRTGKDFDIILPGENPEHFDDELVAVPFSVARKWFSNSLAGLPVAVEKLRRGGATHVVLLGTPPPKSNAEDLLRRIKKSQRFIDLAATAGVDLDSTESLIPARSRVKLWKTLQILHREIAEELGLVFIPHPAEAETEDGSLKPEFDPGDISHANSEYGNLVCRDLVRTIKGGL